MNLQPVLQWREPAPANEEIRYDHVIAQTPFGRILITWKGWKSHSSYDVEEAPGQDLGVCMSYNSLTEAKQKASEQYWERLRLAVMGEPQESSAAPAQLPLPALEPAAGQIFVTGLQAVGVVGETPLERSVGVLGQQQPSPGFQHLAPAPVWQMYPTSDPKYSIMNNRLVVTATGRPVEAPIFLFHAKDKHLLAVLQFYLTLLANPTHRVAVSSRYRDIEQWQYVHFYLTKEPDTQLTC